MSQFFPRALPAWEAVALSAPQRAVRVELLSGGVVCDVSENNVVAALDPFTIGIGRAAPDNVPQQHARLRFIDCDRASVLGELAMRRSDSWSGDGVPLDLFEVTAGTQYCLSWSRIQWQRWLGRRAFRRRAHQPVIPLLPEIVERISIFYMCPRPVVLVSIAEDGHDNLFPMDLIGPVTGEQFMLALRIKSDSIGIMRATGRIALADMPASSLATVHALGNLPRGQRVDWNALPFGCVESREFLLRIPATALRVREMQITDSRVTGSHCLFRARTISETRISDAAQLFHTSGFYQALRTREARAFAHAT
jgi:flavin reductase (DIM6/NTAB) family NADH-FMN oxidoreductase RutF